MKCINTKCIRNTCSLQPVVIVALVLNGTNIYGYMRCRWNSSESDPVGTITSAVGLHMLKSVSFLFACFSLSPMRFLASFFCRAFRIFGVAPEREPALLQRAAPLRSRSRAFRRRRIRPPLTQQTHTGSWAPLLPTLSNLSH